MYALCTANLSILARSLAFSLLPSGSSYVTCTYTYAYTQCANVLLYHIELVRVEYRTMGELWYLQHLRVGDLAVCEALLLLPVPAAAPEPRGEGGGGQDLGGRQGSSGSGGGSGGGCLWIFLL